MTTQRRFIAAKSLLIIFVCLLLGGFIALWLGKELNWDLANYHYYNPFVFLHQRWQMDYWPSSFVHVYFTPTLDFLTYFLINYFPPTAAVFMLGALHGLNIWLLYCIANLLLKSLGDVRYSTLFALILALLGLYGPTALTGVGSFQHDDLVSLFVLGFVYLQLRCWLAYPHTQSLSRGWFTLGAVLLGIGIGAKLTAAVFAVGAAGALLACPIPWQQRLKYVVCFGTAVMLGMLLSSGYWMLHLWLKFHNPIFPLLNGVFHSVDFPAYNWKDPRFLPHGWLQTLFYPFYFSFDGRTGDTDFRDFRFAILYVLFSWYALTWGLFRKKESRTQSIAINWLLLFFLVTYIVWQYYFSIMRYIVVLEMLAPLVIFLLLHHLLRDRDWRFSVATAIYIFLVLTMASTHMVRAPWFQGSYFNVSMPSWVKQEKSAALILVPYPAYAFYVNPRPLTYLLPFLPQQWRVAGVPFLQSQYEVPAQVNQFVQRVQPAILYVLGSPDSLPKMQKIAANLGFSKTVQCGNITDDRQAMTHETISICKLKK